MECPENNICFTEEEWINFLNEYELDLMTEMPQPTGDAQAAIDFTWQILFLSPWELIYIALPMTVLAFYGLTIYSIFKYIQKKFS
tara:strand:- start:2067 stop:2321 length:255 start_codon:yes stop_codon:yes gene_type:complete